MGFGFTSDMKNSLKRNREALRSKQVRFREKKLLKINYKGSDLVLDDMDLSREELQEIKDEIREEARLEKMNYWIKLTFICVIVFGTVLSFVIHYLF